ncbi:MAG: hypothetical protein QGH37_05240 [Candidatus Poribacteria bacterium]|nr:hypothetical protein [Candidatus Poribacteria bacterium]
MNKVDSDMVSFGPEAGPDCWIAKGGSDFSDDQVRFQVNDRARAPQGFRG